MKFLCVSCDEAMTLQDAMPAEAPGTLAVVYVCGTCDQQIAMLTNPWETQMVQSLGIKIGPKTGEEGETATSAGCPFSGMLEGLQSDQEPKPEPTAPAPQSGTEGELVWTEEALSRLERIPEFVRPMARQGIEHWARDHGWKRVTEEVLEAARGKMGM